MRGFTVCTFMALLVGGLAVPQDLVSKLEAFKAEHGKQYSGDEDAKGTQKSAEIEAHNTRFVAGEESSRQLNRYSELTDQAIDDQVSEFKLVGDETLLTRNNFDVHSLGGRDVKASLPSEYDAEKLGYVTPVKYEVRCVADYAFAAVALLESHIKRWKNKTLDLSEQEVIDCTYEIKNTENRGCKGGSPRVVLDYVLEHGITCETSYPYTSALSKVHGTCQKDKPKETLPVTNLTVNCGKIRDEEHMRSLLYTGGPFVAKFGFTKSLYRIQDEIYEPSECQKVERDLYVLIVGYGTVNGKPFWRFKNSWGTSWGNDGYGKIARGKNILEGDFCALSSV